jgi:hypothetical protein
METTSDVDSDASEDDTGAIYYRDVLDFIKYTSHASNNKESNQVK